MTGEGIMTHNNLFLGLYNVMFQRVKQCESRCLQKNPQKKGFQEALSIKYIQSVFFFFFSLRCFKATFAWCAMCLGLLLPLLICWVDSY